MKQVESTSDYGRRWQSLYRPQAFFSAAVVVAVTIATLPGVSPLPTPRGTTSVRQVAAATRPPVAQTSPAPGNRTTPIVTNSVPGWPMWRHDPLHQGVSTDTSLSATSAFKLHWSANTAATTTPTKSYSSPAVVFNSSLGQWVVYVGNQEGDMNAYSAITGALIWSYRVGTPTCGGSKEIETSPAVSHGVVYFGDGDCHEYALDATTGQKICRSEFPVNGHIAASSTVANPDGTGDVVYFGDSGPNGNLSDGGHEWAMYGVGNIAGPACGLKWSFDNFGNPPGSQTGISGTYTSQAYGKLADGTPVVILGSTDPDNAIYELNASTGAELWRFQACAPPDCVDADIGAPPTIAAPGTIGSVGSAAYTDGVVFETAKSGFTFAIDLKVGSFTPDEKTPIWSFDIHTLINGSKKNPDPTQSGASLVGQTLYLGYGKGVFSLNAATGAVNSGWNNQPGAVPPISGTTTVTAGVVSSPSISGPPGNQVLFVGDIAGNVEAYRLSDGANLFTYSTGGLIFASAGIGDGQFFISSQNGFVYAFGQ